MKQLKTLAATILFGFSSATIAEEECKDITFSFDENIPSNDQFVFKDDNPIFPRAGDFELLNYYLMSNGCGYRSALVTIKNTSAGTTTFTGENIVALDAGGHKYLGKTERRVAGLASESFTVGFGVSALPIIKIMVIGK